MIIDLFLLAYTILLGMITLWAAYSSYLVFKCGVPPVPTNRKITGTMIQSAGLMKGQQVYDLGCGFGDILLRAATQYPENNYQGFDINKPVIWVAKMRNYLSKKNIFFRPENFFDQDLSGADIIFCYLWPSIMHQIENDIWPQLKPGTKIISHAFPLPKMPATETLLVGRHRVFVYTK